jgi:parallel beta-helix repeat protein
MHRTCWRPCRGTIAGVCFALATVTLALLSAATEAQTPQGNLAPTATYRLFVPISLVAEVLPTPTPTAPPPAATATKTTVPTATPTRTAVRPTATSAPVTGSAFYVATSGNDANPGSEALPWRTITKAANTLTAGATVYIKTGTYNERVLPKNSGSAGKNITYAAYPGQTVTVDGTGISLNNFQGLVETTNRSYIKISGLNVSNSTGAGLFASNGNNIIFEKNHTFNCATSGIGVWGGSNITVDGNDVENSNYGGANEAISFGGVSNFVIRNNHVHNPTATRSKEGIDAKQGSNNGQIYGNTVDHTVAVAIYVDAYDQHTYNIDVFDNVVHDVPLGYVLASEAGGLLENVRHYNNLAYNVQYCGMRVFGQVETTSHPMSNITLINNTVYKSGCGIDVSNAQISGFTIRNNALSQNTKQLQINVATSLLTIDHNLIDGASSTLGSSYVQGSPLFVNAAAGDFSVQAGSPAIDSGSATGAPANDCEGIARPQGAGFDIGSHER